MVCKYCKKNILEGHEIRPFDYPEYLVFCSFECWIDYENSGILVAPPIISFTWMDK